MSKQKILIIGASSDIGINLIESIDEDVDIIAHYNSSCKKIKDVSRSIKNNIIFLKANLAIEEEITNMISEIRTKYGTPNKIVHLAAPKFKNIRFKDLSWSDVENEINVSLKSIIIVLSQILPDLAKLKRGKVVCMLSSVTLNLPPKALVHYTTVKYSLLGLVRSLASEYNNKNIQINAISPSMVETKFLEDINEKIIQLSAYNHPLKRNANCDDIVPMIKFLLSEESDYMNGINIPITGGASA